MKSLVISLIFTSFCIGQENIIIADGKSYAITPPAENISNGAIAMYFLQPKNEFAGNVNIMIQSWDGTVKEYIDLTMGQLKSANLKLVKGDISEVEWKFEYKGKAQGRDLHWYARAVKSNNKILLITATGLETDWEDQRVKFVESVNSFKLQ